MTFSAWLSSAIRDAAEVGPKGLDELSFVFLGRLGAVRIGSPFRHGVQPQRRGAHLDVGDGDVAEPHQPCGRLGVVLGSAVVDQGGESRHRRLGDDGELLDLTEKHANRMAHMAHLGLGHGRPFLFWSGRR